MLCCRIGCLLLLLSLGVTRLLQAEEGARDRCGDPLPPQALARLGTVRFRHGDFIHCLAYSPDGTMLALGGTTRTRMISVWDAHSGRLLRQIEADSESSQTLVFSPDNKFLVSSKSYCTGHDIDAETKGDLCLWEVATGKLALTLAKNDAPTRAVAFSPDGKTIVSAHDSKEVRIWDALTGKKTRVLTCTFKNDSWAGIKFSPDGKTLACVGDGGHIWSLDLNTGKELHRQDKDLNDLDTVAFSPDGAVLAAAGKFGIRLYRASNLEEIKRFVGNQEKVALVAFALNGKTLVSIDKDKITCLWDVGSGKQRHELANGKGECDALFVVSPDGKTVARTIGNVAGVVQFLDAQTGAGREPSGGHFGPVDQVVFQGRGERVAVRVDNSNVWIWPFGTDKDSCPIKMPSGSEAALLCPDRSTLALKTPEGELLLLDIASGRELLRCPITKKMWIEAVCADNKRAAVWVAGNHVEVWDLTTRKAIHQLRPEASCLGMSPEGRMLAVADTQMSTSMNKDHVQVWDLNRKKEVFRCEAGIAQLCKVAFSLDGRIIAIRDRSTTRLIETATGKERLRVEEGFGWIHPLAFSPNGKMLASGNGDGTVRLWDVRDGKELYLFRGHLAPVNAIAFSPDGGRLVSGSTDTTALVWEIPAACRERKFPLEKLGQQESAKLWGKLVNTEDASVAYAALQRLAGAPKDAVSLCREHLLAQPIPPEQILRGIALLDADDYAVREQATRDLERIGLQANDALENALKGECSPEVRRRIETVREMWEKKQQRLPLVRAVELLEQIGTAEAVDVLRQLARKPGDLGLRDDAQQSLQRLAAKRNTR